MQIELYEDNAIAQVTYLDEPEGSQAGRTSRRDSDTTENEDNDLVIDDHSIVSSNENTDDIQIDDDSVSVASRRGEPSIRHRTRDRDSMELEASSSSRKNRTSPKLKRNQSSIKQALSRIALERNDESGHGSTKRITNNNELSTRIIDRDADILVESRTGDGRTHLYNTG